MKALFPPEHSLALAVSASSTIVRLLFLGLDAGTARWNYMWVHALVAARWNYSAGSCTGGRHPTQPRNLFLLNPDPAPNSFSTQVALWNFPWGFSPSKYNFLFHICIWNAKNGNNVKQYRKKVCRGETDDRWKQKWQMANKHLEDRQVWVYYTFLSTFVFETSTLKI